MVQTAEHRPATRRGWFLASPGGLSHNQRGGPEQHQGQYDQESLWGFLSTAWENENYITLYMHTLHTQQTACNTTAASPEMVLTQVLGDISGCLSVCETGRLQEYEIPYDTSLDSLHNEKTLPSPTHQCALMKKP